MKPSSVNRSSRTGSSGVGKGGSLPSPPRLTPRSRTTRPSGPTKCCPTTRSTAESAAWRATTRDADRTGAADSPCGRLAMRQAPQASRNRAEIRPRALRYRPLSSRMGIGEGRSIGQPAPPHSGTRPAPDQFVPCPGPAPGRGRLTTHNSESDREEDQFPGAGIHSRYHFCISRLWSLRRGGAASCQVHVSSSDSIPIPLQVFEAGSRHALCTHRHTNEGDSCLHTHIAEEHPNRVGSAIRSSGRPMELDPTLK